MALAVLAGPRPRAAWAGDRTRLLEVDLRTGSKQRIDGGGPKTDADRQLDALLDRTTGKTFTTAELERIERALRRYLQAARPRAVPRLLLFLYPGRITASRLKELREILVEVDLLVDPCSRSICRDAVAKDVELLGKALQQPVLRTGSYVVRFKLVTVRTATEHRATEYETYRFSAEEVVTAGQRGDGLTLVKRQEAEAAGYERAMVKAIARRLQARRVPLDKPPAVRREGAQLRVNLHIKSDRVRYQSSVLAALAGAMEALRQSSLTPATVQLEVVAAVPMRQLEHRTFRCPGHSVLLHLDGRLTGSELWSSYVAEEKKQGTRLAFDDREARGGGAPTDDDDEDPQALTEVLSGQVGTLAPCLQQEAARSSRFKGVTLVFAVGPDGRASRLALKEAGASSALRSCLARALERLQFPRRRGAPRQVSFPLYIQR
ncbi:MAG: hypothetical protein IT371_21010 [Deltaproteobacteria bacterium]|nr:hypothetical protein [Deltaproteobacteria bacterium]